MSVFQGDFLGFTLGNEHSSTVNIVRVSSSDRYMDGLVPSFVDSTAQVPGGDGTYYWDTFYTQKLFNISFAFDGVTDANLRKMRNMFSFKGVKPLIFDEFPEKKYMVKCTEPPVLNYICFGEGENRIYKGEGSLSLVAYFPFGIGVEDTNITYAAAGSSVSNVGDKPAAPEVVYAIGSLSSGVVLSSTQGINTPKTLTIGNVTALSSSDSYVSFNFRTQLIEGLDSSKKKTGTLYNKYIASGDFFTIPVGNSTFTSSVEYQSAKFAPIYY